MSKMKEKDRDSCTIGCGCFVILFNLLFGAMSVNYLLMVFTEKTIPLIWAIVIGAIGGQFTVPVAVVVYILKMLSVI